MNLLILNGPRDGRQHSSPQYRGTYRSHPSHCDELADDHEINKLFFWFLEEGGELGVVHDLTKALRFAHLWNARLKNADRFEVVEVVEVVEGNHLPASSGAFLGFDLSAGFNNSLLAWGLRQVGTPGRITAPILQLLNLLDRHYAPQLNNHGLFQSLEVTSQCLRDMTALQELSPNLFEGGTLDVFRPTALYRVLVV